MKYRGSRYSMKSQSLSHRLFLLIVILSFAALLISTALEVLLGYRNGIKRINANVQFVKESYLPSIATSLWEYDEDQLQLLLDGMLKLEGIAYCKVKDNKGLMRNEFSKGDEAATANGGIEIPILHHSRNNDFPPIGTLTLYLDSRAIYKRLWEHVPLHALSISVMIAFIALAFIFLFERIIARHLHRMADFAKGIDLSHLDSKLELSRSPRQDELEQVVASINALQDRLRKDIEERKNAERLLSESEKRYRSLYDNVPVGVFRTRPNGDNVSVNQALLQMMGISETTDVTKLNAGNYYLNPEDREYFLNEIERNGQITGYECRFKKQDGSLTWVCLSARGIKDDSGGLVYLDGVVEDINARKTAEKEKEKLQDQLIQVQKMEAIGQLAGGIAHDFNNMLSVVLGNTELAIMKIGPNNEIGRHLKSIEDAAHRSSSLVRQLLAFARKQTTNPIVLDINDTISGMLKVLNRLIGEDIELAWIPGERIGKAKIDPSQIDQILANLMVNARDAIGGVGKVTIETSHVILDHQAGITPGPYVMLAISDNGCGMSKDTLEQIFEPFFTTKKVGRGTGLGLATVYGIVKQNHGFVNVYSEPGIGTTFKIYFPQTEAPATQSRSTGPPEPLPNGSETVLVVEDDEPILVIVESVLNQLGYTVIIEKQTDKAIEIAQAFNGRIDLLLTDIIMPLMNGRELAERIETIMPGIKCLYMSGYTADVIAHHGVLEEGVSFLPKPFSIRDLALKVREAIDH